MKNKIKIGLDFHGVVDEKLNFFKTLMKLLIDNGHEVHIITGGVGKVQLSLLKKLKIPYTHFFSITDYHTSRKTPILWDENNEPHLDPYLWDKAKGEYCKKNKIDLHFDDSEIYHYFFKTPYARFYSRDSKRTSKIKI
jgi:hypothetical protein